VKLLALTAVILAIAGSIFSSIRLWGESQTHKPFENTFFAARAEERLPLVIVPWEQKFFLEKNPNWILWIDVYRGEAEQLLVKPWADKDSDKKTLVQKPGPTRPLLKELLEKFPNTRFVVNCNDNVENIHLQLVQVIEEAKASDRVLIQSDYGTILTSAKKEKAMMVFGSTMGDLTRLKTYDSLYLLPAANFKGDVFFTSISYRNRETITAEISKELKRRHKKIILGPLSNKEEVDKALALGADGLFLADPTITPL
jgi:hypothetical protein